MKNTLAAIVMACVCVVATPMATYAKAPSETGRTAQTATEADLKIITTALSVLHQVLNLRASVETCVDIGPCGESKARAQTLRGNIIAFDKLIDAEIAKDPPDIKDLRSIKVKVARLLKMHDETIRMVIERSMRKHGT